MTDKVIVVLSRDLSPFSTVSVGDLEALVADGLLRPLSGEPQPEWMAPGSGVGPTPPSGYVVSFIPFHERGFSVPASCFMWALLHYYRVELHNFNPNSIAQADIFAAVCEGFLGIDPHWDLWLHLFSAEFFAATTEAKKVRMVVWAGGCTLQLRPGRAQQYIPASLASSNKGWQNRWFYLHNDDGRLPPFSQRVVTAAGVNWRWGATREKQEKLQPILQALQKLRDGGPYRCGGRRRYPSSKGAPFGRAAVAACRDEAGSRFGGLANVLGLPLRRRPPQAGSRYGREAGRWHPYPARDAPWPWVCVPGKCPILFLFCAEFFTPLILTIGIFVRPQGLRIYKPVRPPVLEDTVG
jgi:hypothetical protein